MKKQRSIILISRLLCLLGVLTVTGLSWHISAFASSNILFLISGVLASQASSSSLLYPIVDTGQTVCYNNTNEISCPGSDDDFTGQDTQHSGYKPNYTDNGDGTITDTVTGLMWQQKKGVKKGSNLCLTHL